jgi:hypothetical protein
MFSPRLRTRSIRALAAMSILAIAAACGAGDDTDVTGTGNLGSTFSATVTGSSAGSYSGFASAVQSAGLFSIAMSSADGKFALAFTRNGTRPAVGTYQLGLDPQNGFTAAFNLGAGQSLYSSGTLTITESSPSELKGTYSVSGSGTSASATSNIKGSFTAACSVSC